jgi:predicted transcriptional regulator
MTVRELFKEQVKFLAENIRSPSLKEQPLTYFLRVLLESVDITKTKFKESKHYFQLLISLL